MTTLLIFLAMLLVLVLVHELGHFVTAKRAGVKVLEFGFGFPPRLFAIPWRGTEYSVNLLPLGGFVRMLGEEDPSHPESLAAQRIPVRFLVLAAGSLMNIALAIVLFTAGHMVPRETIVGPVQVIQVMPGSPAERAGLLPGDRILKINDRPVRSIADVHYNILLNLGSEITMLVERERLTRREVRVAPRWNPPPGEGETGIVVGMPSFAREVMSFPLWEAVPLGVRQAADMLTLAKNGIIIMIVKGLRSDALVGPIGIYQATGEVAQTGTGNLMTFAAFLSMNLAIFNLLPIPMLDGGRLLFVVIEALRGGRRISPRRENLVHLVGFVLLLTLVVIISWFDLLRVLRGEELFR